jgi:hypothetical protein
MTERGMTWEMLAMYAMGLYCLCMCVGRWWSNGNTNKRGR